MKIGLILLCYNEIMAVIAPNTEIYLIKTPIELDNENQLNFANATAQYNYFSSLPKVTLENATFQRKDGYIRWPASMESVLNYNYCMYRNKSHGNKWFYAFITNIEYASDSSCNISIKTDVWQTWQFDLTFKKCFVEREHVADDTFGLHTIPEGIEYGEYVVSSSSDVGSAYNFTNCYLIAQVSQLCDAMYSLYGSSTRIYGGLPQGTWFIAIYGETNAELYQNFENFVRSYDAENLSNAIVAIFVAPKALVSVGEIPFSFPTEYGFDAYNVTATVDPSTLGTYTITRNSTIDGYTPKNNKLFTSPYNYLMVTNNGGTDICYAWEDFNGNASFTEKGIINQGCDIKLIPTNYKRTSTYSGGYEWCINRQKFPTISWNSDYYLNWVAVNGKYQEVQAGLTGINFGMNVISGMLSGNVNQMVGALPSLAQSVADQAQQIREAQMTPDSSKGNNNTGDLNYTLGKNCFTCYKMCIKAEYAKICDDYMTQFGYKVNSLKIPELNSRRYWNYVKTQGCNITGDVPQEDIEEIKGLFNRGFTIWHDPTKFLDYSQNNTIVS